MNQSDKQNEFYEDGKPKVEYEHHENGKIKCKREYFKNGQLSNECPYNENGREEGVYRSWFENGQPSLEVHKLAGQNHGSWKSWGLDGTLQQDRSFIYGEENGISRYFGKKGKVETQYYSNGEIIFFEPEQSHLMTDFLENLGYKVEPPQLQNRKTKKKEYRA